MQTGLFFNSLICLITAGFTFFTAWYVYRNNKNNLVDVSCSGFWLFAGITWFFVGISLVIFHLGFAGWDVFINQYIIQTVIYAQIVAGTYYVAFRVLKNHRLAKKVFWLFCVLAIIGLGFTYQKGGVLLGQISYYSTEYKINQIAWQIFQVMVAVALFGILYDSGRNLYYRFWRKELFEIKYFLVNLSVIVYGVIGYFDQQGYTAAWTVIVMRMIIIFCAQTAYLAYSNKEL